MFEKIKRLGTDTAIYGVSTIVGRFLTFILTPIYTHFLPPDELGIVATVYAYIAFLNVIYGYGMESAFMKYASTLELGDTKQTFTVPFVSVGISSFILSLLVIWRSEPLADLIHLPREQESVVIYAAWILCLDAIALVPFAALRMGRKAATFAAIKMTNIVVNVACNILFLVTSHMGVKGIFLSGVISSAVTVVLLFPTILSNLKRGWSRKLYGALLQFGLPYVPAGLATMMIQVIDRPILEALAGKATVGIYQANYRLGIFMMLIVSMYDFAWRPFFLSHAGDADAKRLFARILTYFVLLMASAFLVLSFFLGDIVRLPVFWGHPLVDPAYWGGLMIVPVVLLAYIFLGIYNNLVAGIYIQKETKHLPLITFTGAFVNVVGNYLLIPPMGMMGAAVATLLSYAIMATVLYFTVQHFYPVLYEIDRIAKVAVVGGIVFGLYHFVDLGSFELAWKIGLLLLFVSLLCWMRFFIPSELKGIASFISMHPPKRHDP